jgi:hypothetical protein
MGKFYSNGDINGTWRSGRKLADVGREGSNPVLLSE